MGTKIYSADTDGYIYLIVQSGPTWASVRDATDGDAASSTALLNATAIRVYSSTSRGGAYQLWRSFFAFDTSAISQIPESVTLNIRGYSAATGNIIAVKATVPNLDDDLTAADFDAIAGSWSGTSMVNTATTYSQLIHSWSVGGYNTITLNDAALIDMANEDVLKIALVNYDYDYLNVDPVFAAAVDATNGLVFRDFSTELYDPYIEYVPQCAGTTVGGQTNQFEDGRISDVAVKARGKSRFVFEAGSVSSTLDFPGAFNEDVNAVSGSANTGVSGVSRSNILNVMGVY